MAISKKATTKDGNPKTAKSNKATVVSTTTSPDDNPKGAEKSKSETPLKEQKQRKEAKKSSCEGATVEFAMAQENADKDIQEVYNQDLDKEEEGKTDEENEEISVDFSDMNENDKGEVGFITHYWDGVFPEAMSALTKRFAETPT